MNLSKLITLITITGLGFSSCERDSIPAGEADFAKDRASRLAVCSTLGYADSVLFIRNQPSDYTIAPVKALQGTYSAWPEGLAINPTTGVINVDKSETGLKYKVYFVQTGTSDTCTFDLTVAGIDYPSSLYMLSRNDTLVRPVYNGSATFAASATTNKSYGSGSAFDNVAPAATQTLQGAGVDINPQNAIINLKRTLKNGALGAVPENGASRVVRLYYRLNDASNKALNHIDIRLTYFKQLSDVPASLLDKINPKNARSGVKPAATTRAYSEDVKKPRPPDIVIVG